MPTVEELLHAAVVAVGGTRRDGQVEMAQAVARAVDTGEHLIVQAGTGTGKSLAYLVPALQHAFDTGRPAVIATATLALQAQVVERDMPRVCDALEPLLGRRPVCGLVKGRRNYLCVHKLAGGFPEDPDADTLLAVGDVDREESRLGQEVVRLREWAERTTSGDRDDLVPGVSERAWGQVSVSAQECLGSRCPMAAECFVERSREAAGQADLVVTNHAMMAIDAFEGRQLLPEHDLLVVDEAHELVDRVTATVTDEVSAGAVRAAARRAGRLVDASTALDDAAGILDAALEPVAEGRLTSLPDALGLALGQVRDAARSVQSELTKGAADADGVRQVAKAAADDLLDVASRFLEERELDVAWLARDPRRGPVLRVAPMSVAMVVRDKVFQERTVVLTSATLELGGSFDAVAGTMGLRGEGSPVWRGIDVGSPFDYPRQAIAYVAHHLPPPGRDGLAVQTLDEIEALVRAAGGRTLGLFSSMRAAREATEAMRQRCAEDSGDIAFLCQGEDQIATLVRQFAGDPRTCLFGTLSLWQGVDVPGSACQLVLIDRIPFPRPDDPLASARSQAIARMGGNGFMAVSATHAALRLAQGAGRLVRRGDDRGVVAFLDSRMMTARYAGFLQRSLPPFWPTADREMVLAALRRLDETAAPPVAVAATAGSAGSGDGADSGGADSDGADSGGADSDGAASDGAASDGADSGGAASGTVAPDGAGAPAWTPEADEELRDGVELGLSVGELGESLDLAPDVVAARLQELGLGASQHPTLSFE
jgi:ATP-dependent DNA helicase DinG